MGIYRKKPIVIEAHRWFKNGDHPKDSTEIFIGPDGIPFDSEGKIVRYFRRPDVSGKTRCRQCLEAMHAHGWIDATEGGHVVCRGDWIITGVRGEYYPVKDDIFKLTYEPVDAK